MSKQQTSFWDQIKSIVFIVAVFVLLKTSVAEGYRIPSGSMEDTLLVGDFIITNKFVYGARLPLVNWQLPAISDPEAGDVVVFYTPLDSVTRYIKRCVATPGDTVEVRDKVLLVNGAPFADPTHAKYIDTTASGERIIRSSRPGQEEPRDNFGPFVVPADTYFMMGDNRDNSQDSRYWKTVPRELILGEAMMIYFSWDDSANPTPSISIADPMSVPRAGLHSLIHFFEKVRWGRLIRPIS